MVGLNKEVAGIQVKLSYMYNILVAIDLIIRVLSSHVYTNCTPHVL